VDRDEARVYLIVIMVACAVTAIAAVAGAYWLSQLLAMLRAAA
jgi:hypothetical protein